MIDKQALQTLRTELELIDGKYYMLKIMLACGLTLEEVGEILGMSKQGVYYYKKKYNL